MSQDYHDGLRSDDRLNYFLQFLLFEQNRKADGFFYFIYLRLGQQTKLSLVNKSLQIRLAEKRVTLSADTMENLELIKIKPRSLFIRVHL